MIQIKFGMFVANSFPMMSPNIRNTIFVFCILYVVVFQFVNLQTFFHKCQTQSTSTFREYFFSYHYKTKNPLSLQLSRQQTLSLTSSPLRIKKDISKVFQSFRDSQIRRILLHLPKLFRNDPSLAQNFEDLARLQKKVPKLEIVWHAVDTGPDLKFTGNFKPGLVDSSEQIVVIDDDTLYHNTLLDHIDQSYRMIAEEDHSKVILSGNPAIRFGIPVAPGCWSFAVKFGDLDTEEFSKRMNLYRNCSKWCARHDDWTMGAAFYDLGYTVHKIVDVKPILQTIEGFGDDALHLEFNAPIKNYECAKSIWESREMCPKEQPSYLAKGISDLLKYLINEK